MRKIAGFVVLVWLVMQLEGVALVGVIAGVILFLILFLACCKGFSVGIGRTRFYF